MGLFCLAGLLLVHGCSSDDDNSGTNPVVKQPGDPNDPEFNTAGIGFGFIDDMNGEMFGLMFLTIDTVLAGAPQAAAWKISGAAVPAVPASDSIFLTYHGDTEYWYLYVHTVDTSYYDTGQQIITITVEDSIQFMHGNDIVQYPDSALLTGVNHGVSLLVSNDDLSETIEAHQRFSLAGDLPGFGDVVVGGNASFDVSISETFDVQYCEMDISLAGLFTGLHMNLTEIDAGGCPTSGTANYSGSIAASCVGDTTVSFNDQWAIAQTFDNGVIHYVVENSTYRWEFDEICGSVVAAPHDVFSDILGRLR